MSSPCYGRIVWVELLDSVHGTTFEDHPAVIITPTDEIDPEGTVYIVGISTKKGIAPAEHQVDLPWHAEGKNRTGLTRPCSAVCSWVHEVARRDVRRYGGIVPGRESLRIVGLVRQLGGQTPGESGAQSPPGQS
jgi:hypothetical protein